MLGGELFSKFCYVAANRHLMLRFDFLVIIIFLPAA